MDRSPLASFCPSFRSAPAPGQLYLSAAHRQVLEAMTACIDGDRPVLVLTGEAGTGKTTMAQHLGLSRPDFRLARIGQSRAELIDLNHQLPKALGIPHVPSFDDPGTGPQALAQACRDTGHGTLLIVDEAQGLSDQGLTYLTGLTDPPGGIVLVLAGGAGLDRLLASPAHDRLRARIGGRFLLSPLNAAETADYVAHRFRVSGCACHAGVQVFDAAATRHLHALSRGIPRIINHLVQSCLFEAGTTGRNTLDGAFVQNCLSSLIRDGRLSHLLGPAAAPRPAPPVPQAVPPARPVPAPAPAPVPAQDRPPPPVTQPRQDVRAVRIGAAVLAGLLVLVPARNLQPPPGTAVTALAPPLARQDPPPGPVPGPVPAPLPRVVTVDSPPAPERLLAEALTLGSADPARAARLYARAALWGNGRAAYYLGQLYETGVGVDADPIRARAWYRAAGDTGGAAARLADLSAPPKADPTAKAAPVPVLQMLFDTGQTELHWDSPPDAGSQRFRVEAVPAGDDRIHRIDTSLTAALVPFPVRQWRVMALRGDGTTGPASGWSHLTPGPR